MLLPLLSLAALLALIWFLGTGRFGRAQSQAWIDRVRGVPKLNAWLNKHHGKFRAATHYLEFGGLFLVLYWCWCALADESLWRWVWWRGVILFCVCAVAAYLDELHQLKSGTRQFRREDFLHSICGISGSAAIVCWWDFLT